MSETEESTVQLDVSLAAGPTALAARWEEVSRELARIDGHLGALFRAGHELLPRLDQPGVVYLVAHCGREVAAAVVRALTPVMPELLDGERALVAERESDTLDMARFLGEQPRHPTVQRWAEVYRRLQSSAHVRVDAGSVRTPDVGGVHTSYLALSDLLYGRVAPFFRAQAELEVVTATPRPGQEDLERLRPLLLRPVQRQRFFGNLAHAGWVTLLDGVGFFRRPPDLVTGSDGLQRARPWIEGRYLVRIASEARDAVLRILREIPPTNGNPLVWRSVADAAVALPPEMGRALVTPLLRACRDRQIAGWCAHTLVTLAQRLAAAECDEAFTLVDGLLYLVRTPPAPPPDEPPQTHPTTESDTRFAAAGSIPESEREGDAAASRRDAELEAAMRRFARRRTNNTAWMLERVEPYEFTRVLDLIVPELEKLDGFRTLSFLAQKLHVAVRLGLTADAEDDAREEAEEAGATAPVEVTPSSADGAELLSARGRTEDPTSPAGEGLLFGEPVADGSDSWAEWLDRPGPDHDIRSHLAAAVTGLAQRLAARGLASAERVDVVLRAYPWDVFARIRLSVLATAGPLAPEAIVDAVVASPLTLDRPYGAREVAAALRAQFPRASAEARATFVARLRVGPPANVLSRLVQRRRWWMEQRPSADPESSAELAPVVPDDDLRAEMVREWQGARLRWFHDRLPEDLTELARALGIEPRIPSPREQASDEGVSWSSGVHSRAHRSPIEADTLAQMRPDEVLTYLETSTPPAEARWAPERADVEPSREGLLGAIADMVERAPERGAALAELMAERLRSDSRWAEEPEVIHHVSAVLRGFAFRRGAISSACWPGLRALIHQTLVNSHVGHDGSGPARSSPVALSRNASNADAVAPPVEQEASDPGGEGDGRERPAVDVRGRPADSQAFDWHETVATAIQALERFADADALPGGAEADFWEVVGDVVSSQTAWERSHASRAVRTFRAPDSGSDGIESTRALVRLAEEAFQAPAGRLTRLLITAARWHVRVATRRGPAHNGSDARGRAVDRAAADHVAPYVRPLIAAALAREGRDGRLVRVIVGEHFAFLYWLDPAWFGARVDELLGNGETPVAHPAWGEYLARGAFWSPLFRRIRNRYANAAAAEPRRARDPKAQFDVVGVGLVRHVFHAVLHGTIGVRDPSGLVDRVFMNTDVRDRGRVYWETFRWISDAKRGATPRVIRRLLAFWQWRLERLEAETATPEVPARARPARGMSLSAPTRDTAAGSAAARGGVGTRADEVAAEATELLWLLATPGLYPAETVVTLAIRTARLARRAGRTMSAGWHRLPDLAAARPAETFALAETLVEAELARDALYLPYDDLAPVLRLALANEAADLRERALRLIDRMGERDHFEFRELRNE